MAIENEQEFLDELKKMLGGFKGSMDRLNDTLSEQMRTQNRNTEATEKLSNIYTHFSQEFTEDLKKLIKANELLSNSQKLSSTIHDESIRRSLSSIPTILNKLGLRKEGKIDIYDKKGNIDPNKVFYMQEPFVKAISEFQEAAKEKEEADEQAHDLKYAKSTRGKNFYYKNYKKREQAIRRAQNRVEQLRADENASPQKLNQAQQKLQELQNDFTEFNSHLTKKQKTIVDYYSRNRKGRKEIEQQIADEQTSAAAKHEYKSGILAMRTHEEEKYHLLGSLRQGWNLSALFKAGRQGQAMGMDYLNRAFQFGSNSLTSNISKGISSFATKAAPKIISGLGKFGGPIVALLTTIAGLLKRGVDAWLEYEEKTLEIAKNMGMGAADMHGYQNAIMWSTAKYAAQYGLDKDTLLNIQATSNEATGRNTILNEEQLIDAVAAKKFMGDQNYAALMKSFELAGGSADSAMKYGMMTMERAAKMGLNMQKASADFAHNMDMVNKYSFKNGVDGISKMTLLSEQLKFNMENMTALFDKTSTIEGSIDVAAQMQMLGGTYATQFGNPMRLLYNSLNNVEELTQTVIDTVVSKGKFNEKTGTVEINNVDRAFIKEMSKQIGVSQEDLFNMANRQIFISEVTKHMSNTLTEAQRGQLANMASYSQTQGWVVSYLDKNNDLVTKQISEVHAEDMEAINKGRMYDTVEDNVENIWLLLKSKYRDAAVEATSLKAKKAGIDTAADSGLGRGVGTPMGWVANGTSSLASRVNDAFFYKDGTVHPLSSDDNVYAFKGSGQVDPGASKFYNNTTSQVRTAEQLTQTFIKGSSNVMASALTDRMRSVDNNTSSTVKFRETENMYASIESSVSKAVSNTIKAGSLKTDISLNGTLQLKFPDGTSMDIIKQLQRPDVIHAIGNIVAQQLARMDNKGATPALGNNMLKGTSF